MHGILQIDLENITAFFADIELPVGLVIEFEPGPQ